MADATDFRTSDKTTNTFFKGAGFNKSEPEKKQEPPKPSKPQNRGFSASNSASDDTGGDFDSLSDVEKQCWNYVALNYDGIRYPDNWAWDHSLKSGLPRKELADAADRFLRDYKKVKMSREETLKYPWWSAARNWDPEQIGKIGKKMSSGLNMYKFDPDMAASVQNRFR